MSNVDTELIASELRSLGYKVNHIVPVSANAGDWTFEVDGVTIDLEEARALLESGEHRKLDTRYTHGYAPGDQHK